MNDSEKKDSLLELIDELCNSSFSENKPPLAQWLQRISEIYSDNYRHNYADISYKLQNIFVNTPEQDSEICEILGENLNVLGEYIERQLLTENKSDPTIENIAKSYKKFADHIHLEIGRYNFIKRYFIEKKSVIADTKQDPMLVIQELKGQIDETSNAVNKIRPIATRMEKELDNLDSKLENNKVSSITTITIFSAVVLTFSGSIAFESGILQGMHTVSKYRLIFVITLTGFILFNTVFSLLYLVGKFINKPISKECKYIKDDSNIYPHTQASIWCKLTHQYAYTTIINIILLWIMYDTYLLWFYHPISLNSQTTVYLLLPWILLIIICFGRFICKHIQKRRAMMSKNEK